MGKFTKQFFFNEINKIKNIKFYFYKCSSILDLNLDQASEIKLTAS